MLTATTIMAIIGYINSLKPKFLKKVRRTTFESLLFIIDTEAGELSILADPEKGIFLPIQRKPKLVPSKGFILNLKRMVEKSKILEIDQPPFERIVHFHLTKKGEVFHLYLELFGGGNIVLTDSDGRIKSCMRALNVRHRQIKTGIPYKLPPMRGIRLDEIDLDDLYSRSSSSRKNIAAFLVSNLAIGGDIVEEALARMEIIKDIPSRDVDYSTMSTVIDEIRSIVKRIEKGDLEPALIYKGGVPVAITSFKPITAEHVRVFDTLNEAGDELFYETILKERIHEIRKVERLAEKSKMELVSRLKDQRDELVEKSKRIRASAENLYVNVSLIEEMFSDLSTKIKSDDKQTMIDKRYGKFKITDIDLKNKNVTFTDSECTYTLNFHIPSFSSIGELYERAKKVERGIMTLDERIEKTERETTSNAEERALEEKELFETYTPRKKRWYERFKWTYSTSDILILAGRDATTNEILIKKHCEPDDIVFHTDIPGSPFVLVKTQGHPLNEETIQEAAIFTSSHSRGWKMGIEALDTYWVESSQVSKKSPSGEYIKKGSFMIYGKRNYVKNVKLELAIGLLKEEGDILFIVGPASSISKRCTRYRVIRPGRMKKMDAVRRIVDALLVETGVDSISPSVRNRMADELLQYLPSGGMDIVKNLR